MSALVLDELRAIRWLQTSDAVDGRNRPESVAAALMGEDERESKIIAFSSPEDYRAKREAILEGINNG